MEKFLTRRLDGMRYGRKIVRHGFIAVTLGGVQNSVFIHIEVGGQAAEKSHALVFRQLAVALIDFTGQYQTGGFPAMLQQLPAQGGQRFGGTRLDRQRQAAPGEYLPPRFHNGTEGAFNGCPGVGRWLDGRFSHRQLI